MTKKTYILVLVLLVAIGVHATKYAGEIFQLSSGVVNQAMGNTGLTFGNSLSVAYWNPALLADTPLRGIEAVHTRHFEGLLQQNQFSIISSETKPISIIINHLGIDKVKLTALENPSDSLSNENRPIVIKTVSNHDIILYSGIARQLGGGWVYGVSPKFVYRSLAENNGWGFGADLGVLYDRGSSLALGANLRNVFSTQVLWENGTHEIAIPSLDLEAGYRKLILGGRIPVFVALRSQVYAEDREEASTLSASIFSADFHAGVSIVPVPEISLMGGYDIDSVTAGIALRLKRFGFDYAFKDGAADGLGSTQRIAMSIFW